MRITLSVLAQFMLLCSALAQEGRPNILWITSEDNGPQLGCYGDEFATTPHLDALASRGLVYRTAWSNAPVCAPARTTIISGMYATSTGAQHMRSLVSMPAGTKMFPQYMREAGYYCTNRSKEDYNLRKPGQVWDDSSGKAHWRGRAAGQPFFAVFNITVSHESQIRRRPHDAVHDPATVPLPSYHPDHPEVRRDWAQYHDKVTEMDERVGRVLAQLDEDGLRDSTIVVYFGDHGPGMPRGKRWPYDSGLHVPFIVSIPEALRRFAPEGYEAGGTTGELVSFVDLAPTMLSLAGIAPLEYMQGRAFLGTHAAPEPPFLHGFRGRMDERYDLVRSVRDGQFVYVRNFMPHEIYGQHVAYMFEMPTTRIWKKLFDEGRLNDVQSRFWQRKAAEELYDVTRDPDEVVNLVGRAEHSETLSRMRAAQREHALAIRDLGFLPEADMHARAEDTPPYTLGHDALRYPLERILAMAELASGTERAHDALVHGLADDDAAVRYWAAMGLVARGRDGVERALPELQRAMFDVSPSVRVTAAEAVALHGSLVDAYWAQLVLVAAADIKANGVLVAVLALNALDGLDGRARDVEQAIRDLPRQAEGVPKRMRSYVPRLIETTLEGLETALPRGGRREILYKAVGETVLSLFVHMPAGDAPAAGYPAVVFFFGGGWNSGTPAQFDDQCELLARRGMVAITADYRVRNRDGTTPFACVADGKSALRFVRANADRLGVDPTRIAAGGGSAGGHIAAAIATVPGCDDDFDQSVSCKPDALILFNPVFDNGPGGYGHARLGDRWRELSPAHNIAAGFPPAIVFLGTEDKLIPVETAQSFAAKVHAVGGRCDLKLYEGSGHGFFNRGRKGSRYDETVADMTAFLVDLGWIAGDQF